MRNGRAVASRPPQRERNDFERNNGMNKKLMMLVTALAVAFGARAETETVGGYTWTYHINGDTAEIYNDGSVAISPEPTGVMTIPFTLGGKPVTSIGDRAFFRCSGLTSVTIGNSVTNIGEYAFAYCDGLTAVEIPNSVRSVYMGAFAYCNNLKNAVVPQCMCALASTTGYPSSYYSAIKSSVGVSRVFGCQSMYEASYSGTVTYPENPALTNIVVASGTTYVADLAFADCKNLQSVTIPASVTRIGDEAFKDCVSLARLVFAGDAPDVGNSLLIGTPRRLGVIVQEGTVGWSGGGNTELPSAWCDRAIVYADGSGTGDGSTGGSSGSGTSGGGAQTNVDPRYDLANDVADRAVASVTVDGDCEIDKFVLKDGKVYDCVIRIVNTSETDAKLTLPAGYEYETFKGAKPLTIPANSRNLLTITRTADKTFLVSREELSVIE